MRRSYGITIVFVYITPTWFAAGGVVYGSSGDFGPAPLTAVEARSGKVLWQNRAFSKASFVLAGDRLFVVDDDGSVAIATISAGGMKVLSEAQLLRANAWTAPVVSGSRLFVRDRHKIMALLSNNPAALKKADRKVTGSARIPRTAFAYMKRTFRYIALMVAVSGASFAQPRHRDQAASSGSARNGCYR